MAAASEEYADGRLNMQLNRVMEMELEKKCSKVGTIARFDWELGAMKHNILSSEDNTPKPHLYIFVQCNERLKRLDGWSCTARIKFTLESEKKTKTFSRENVRYPTDATQQNHQFQQQSTAGNTAYLQIPLEQLEEEFQLSNANANNELEATAGDCLQISAQITVIEQFGYGTLIQLNTRLLVYGNAILVNKFHLAAYSAYFQAFFFSDWSKDAAEFELNDPDDDLEALKLMLDMALPIENYPRPTDFQMNEVLRLADKYDLQIVSERCEKLLMAEMSSGGVGSGQTDMEKERPLIKKLALAEKYGLYNLKTQCLEQISPAHFCLELRQNIAVYQELSPGLKAELDERMARKSADELGKEKTPKDENGGAGGGDATLLLLPPPHKRIRPRPKTPPRPNFNLPPFRFK